jgi:outer membrane murein-binding lipoprotein Lpp
MSIFKAHWDTEGDNVRLSMPFSKVDQERRIVSGFATLDNVDKQSDIVTTEASMKAFAKFRGNIREMHQPTAVGKMVSFKEDKYFDPKTKKFYTGVYVSAYVSKGAQDTWEKVLDGTLSGFSIGGRMNKWDDAFDEKMEKSVRIIKEYDLIELSLVDNPANQFANILSVEKVDGIDVVKGDILDTVVENVFWDAESGIVMVSENESELSPTSGAPMQNIGFVEKNDNEKVDMIKFLVDSAKGIDLSKMTKEASPMNETTTEDVIKSDDAVEVTEVAPEADAVAETVEKADEAEVVKADESEPTDSKSADMDEDEMKAEKSEPVEEVSKSDDVIVEAVTEIKNNLTSAFSDLASTIKSLHEQVNALSKSLETVSGEVNSVKSEVQNAKSEFNEFGKRVDAVEADTAFRKSGDLGEIVQEYEPELVQKSLWGGRFLKTADLFR